MWSDFYFVNQYLPQVRKVRWNRGRSVNHQFLSIENSPGRWMAPSRALGVKWNGGDGLQTFFERFHPGHGFRSVRVGG